jgi:hypothetical protein
MTAEVINQEAQAPAAKRLSKGCGKLQKGMTGSQVETLIGGGWDYQPVAVDPCISMKKVFPWKITSDAFTLFFGAGDYASWTMNHPPLLNTGKVLLQMGPE